MKRINRSIAAATLASTLVLALASLLVASARTDDDDEDAPRFSDWSAPVNLGPPVNTPFAEMNPFISKDGRSLYFTCFNCPGNLGGSDIWVSQPATGLEGLAATTFMFLDARTSATTSLGNLR